MKSPSGLRNAKQCFTTAIEIARDQSAKSGELAGQVIATLQEEGYTFVRLDQIPAYQQYQTPPTETSPVVATNAGAASMRAR